MALSTHDQPPWGFHDGELAVQRRAGVEAEAVRLKMMLAPAELRGGVAAFLADRTFAALTGRDRSGLLWVSPLTGPPGFLSATSLNSLQAAASIPDGDPLHGLAAGQPVGLVVIEFATRRRVRINGVLADAGPGRLAIDVDQAYGNCPQYIQQRLLSPDTPIAEPQQRAAPRLGTLLEAQDAGLIRRSDTFFLGTTHPLRGADASHRGGPSGFVRVEGDGRLWWPDYPGNNMFNSFGNLEVNPEAALLFINFESGRMLHLSGSADIEWTKAGEPGDDGGTGRRVWFTLQRLVADRFLAARETHHRAYPGNPGLTD